MASVMYGLSIPGEQARSFANIFLHMFAAADATNDFEKLREVHAPASGATQKILFLPIAENYKGVGKGDRARYTGIT